MRRTLAGTGHALEVDGARAAIDGLPTIVFDRPAAHPQLTTTQRRATTDVGDIQTSARAFTIAVSAGDDGPTPIEDVPTLGPQRLTGHRRAFGRTAAAGPSSSAELRIRALSAIEHLTASIGYHPAGGA